MVDLIYDDLANNGYRVSSKDLAGILQAYKEGEAHLPSVAEVLGLRSAPVPEGYSTLLSRRYGLVTRAVVLVSNTGEVIIERDYPDYVKNTNVVDLYEPPHDPHEGKLPDGYFDEMRNSETSLIFTSKEISDMCGKGYVLVGGTLRPETDAVKKLWNYLGEGMDIPQIIDSSFDTPLKETLLYQEESDKRLDIIFPHNVRKNSHAGVWYPLVFRPFDSFNCGSLVPYLSGRNDVYLDKTKR